MHIKGVDLIRNHNFTAEEYVVDRELAQEGYIEYLPHLEADNRYPEVPTGLTVGRLQLSAQDGALSQMFDRPALLHHRYDPQRGGRHRPRWRPLRAVRDPAATAARVRRSEPRKEIIVLARTTAASRATAFSRIRG